MATSTSEDFTVQTDPFRRELLAQFLPARQRAVLILREVLDWPAADVAAALDMTTAAVNSALQRARARLGEAGLGEDQIDEPADPGHRAQIDRYVVAFENADLAALEKLLTDDALLEMPPFLNWYVGREPYIRFIARVFTLRGTDWRMVPVHANGQPALAAYTRAEDGGYALHTLQVFTVTESGISRNTLFQDQERRGLTRPRRQPQHRTSMSAFQPDADLSGDVAFRLMATSFMRLFWQSAGVRRRPGGRGPRGRGPGNGCHDLDGNVPNAVPQQSCRLAELIMPFRVVLVLGRVAERLDEPVDETFGRRPLANRPAGFGGHLEHIPERGIAPGLRLAEVHIGGVHRVQRSGDLGHTESRPLRDVADRDHVALLQQCHDRSEHRHLAWSPRVFQGPPSAISGCSADVDHRQATHGAITSDCPRVHYSCISDSLARMPLRRIRVAVLRLRGPPGIPVG